MERNTALGAIIRKERERIVYYCTHEKFYYKKFKI